MIYTENLMYNILLWYRKSNKELRTINHNYVCIILFFLLDVSVFVESHNQAI